MAGINVFARVALPGDAPDAKIRRAVAAGLGRLAKRRGEINVVFVSGAEMRRINAKFLRKNRLTDVIAFNYAPEKTASGEMAPLGDIFVCVPQARRQARALKHSAGRELLLLAAHGALHLSGMDDKNKIQRAAMDRKACRIVDGL